MACWYGLRLSGLIACVFVCCDFTGGFWLAGGLKRALATQLGSSDRARWLRVLGNSVGLDNAVSLCRFVHLWLVHLHKARLARASPHACETLSCTSITPVGTPQSSATRIHAPKRWPVTIHSAENSQGAHWCRSGYCPCVLRRQNARCRSHGDEARDSRGVKNHQSSALTWDQNCAVQLSYA